ncbi:MAG: Y-family DNA polymerase [Muribaculaceae bacterium]|nr:Y-family DNA polymerase [Muribaculaceae bacterium]
MIGLADCNNFFVSCERSVDRSLEGKAVVVLSNNDGCVVARSNESKRMGVRMGQPAFEIRDMIAKGELIALSGNHLLYRDISLRVHDIFRRFVPSALDYSIDESFLDMTGIPVEVLPSIGEAIYKTCWDEMHIPVTIGFAPTKTLAKIATETAKKGGERVSIIYGEEDAMPILDKMNISDLWGVGRRLSKKLYQNGVYTIGDFARCNSGWVRQSLGVTGERSWLELHCRPCIELEHVDRLLQDSISESRTFPEDIDDYDYIRARIVIYTSDCARKLRAMQGVAGSIGVYLRTNPFHPHPSGCKPEGAVRLPHPTNDTIQLTEAALHILDKIYLDGVPFKRAGVWIGDISQDFGIAGSLFQEEDEHEILIRRFMQTIDRINNTVGSRNIGLASRIVKGHRGHNDGYSSSFQAPSRKK